MIQVRITQPDGTVTTQRSALNMWHTIVYFAPTILMFRNKECK